MPPMTASGHQEPPTFPAAGAALVPIADAGGQREGAMEIQRRRFLELAAGTLPGSPLAPGEPGRGPRCRARRRPGNTMPCGLRRKARRARRAMRPLHWRPRSVRRHWQCAACFRLGSPRSLKRPRWTFCAPPRPWRTARRRPRGATILRRTAGRLNWVVAPARQCH